MNNIVCIGIGSMAEAIISGMIARGGINPRQIKVANKSNQERLAYIQQQYGVCGHTSLEAALTDADVVFLAVKPKDVLAALTAARPYLTENMLLISVAAGINLASLEGIIEKKMAIVRAMPNTSAAVGLSATALAANSLAGNAQLQTAIDLFTTIGTVSVVEEHKLNAVTGLSGSGPAYIYYVVEAMEKSAQEIGLDPVTAKQLIIQTIQGAAEMLKQSPKTPQTLRKEVTSPGGTTEAGLKVLEQHHVQNAFIACIEEATNQAKRMGDEISKEIKKEISSLHF
ncbi:pyrroline-5-carboxylate reductase [Peribacillus loiseleuriae]|uniref:Pyrroline-5-carboxylate reductase n=1 Tax=Peribacillus loiseleuriae TaxID=1679170 RepID=A0A0K9GVN4_9BACI|nr:pyrroline-5-carboxylate reductase [Peribacillus loiseleuriae]KMY50691.1 pyrroline-5-carboxylate reductase [Peribacillus loiseleuriae]